MAELTADLAPGAVIVECPEPGCDHTIAAYGGDITHRNDGSHSFSYSKGRKVLVVESQIVTVEVSDAVAEALGQFMGEHAAEIDARLIPLGITLNEIAIPTYERIVWRDQAE